VDGTIIVAIDSRAGPTVGGSYQGGAYADVVGGAPSPPAVSNQAIPLGRLKVLPTDPVFDFTADLAALRRASTWQFVLAVIRRRKELRPALARLRCLPRLPVPLSDNPAGRDLTHKLRKGIGPLRPRTHAVAVLEIPQEAGAYRRGGSRRSMRYNIGKAVAEGVSCLTLSGQDEIQHRFAQIIVDGWGVDRSSRKYRRWTHEIEDVPHALYIAAVGADDSALVFAKVIIANKHARLHTFIQRNREGVDGDSGPSRFLLAEYLVESLRTLGVQYIIVDSIGALPRGLRYYQQLAGYTVCNIDLTRPDAKSGPRAPTWLGRRAGRRQAAQGARRPGAVLDLPGPRR
jgi:hypothetical protein